MTPARALAAATLLAFGAAADAQQALTRFTYEQVHFGNIPVEISLYCADAQTAADAASAAFARVAELDAMMSDYALDPPSPLNHRFIIKIKSRHGVTRLGLGRFLLNAQHLAVGIELDDAVALWISHWVSKYCGATAHLQLRHQVMTMEQVIAEH